VHGVMSECDVMQGMWKDKLDAVISKKKAAEEATLGRKEKNEIKDEDEKFWND
jgi:hypothetical protein